MVKTLLVYLHQTRHVAPPLNYKIRTKQKFKDFIKLTKDGN